MNEVAKDKTERTGKTAIPSNDTGAASIFTDSTTVTRKTIEQTIRRWHASKTDLTLDQKGLNMRLALTEAYESLNIARKAAGLPKVRLNADHLDHFTIASIISDHFIIKRVVDDLYNMQAVSNSDLYIYTQPNYVEVDPFGPEDGIYTPLFDDVLNSIIFRIQPCTAKECKDVNLSLRAMSEAIETDKNPDHIYVNNGIYDYKTDELIPFSPELVSTCKILTNYNKNAPDVELEDGYFASDIVNKITDVEYTRDMIMHMIGAAIRTGVTWNAMPWLYGQSGTNGKSMILNLIKDIVGSGVTTEMDLSNYAGATFDMESIIGKHVLITSDSNKKEYLDAMGNLKKITGGDTLYVKRKFKTSLTYTFTGIVLMSMNTMPSMKYENALDKRIYPINFEKNFEGVKNTKIRDDYIHRREVHEWYLKHVLTDLPKYYELIKPAEAADLIREFRDQNSVIIRFLEDDVVQDVIGINTTPATNILESMGIKTSTGIEADQIFEISGNILFALFMRWAELNNEVAYKNAGLKSFNTEFRNMIENHPEYGIECRRYDDTSATGKKRLYSGVNTKTLEQRLVEYLDGSRRVDMRDIFIMNGDKIVGLKNTRVHYYYCKREDTKEGEAA